MGNFVCPGMQNWLYYSSMQRFQWGRLNKQQVGAYTEYFVKMELTMQGFQVYTTEVDDRGIDFVARLGEGHFIQVQVKAMRQLGYLFLRKTYFKPAEHLYLALGLLFEGKAPALYLIPSIVWLSPKGGFVDRNYEGFASEPEWGLNISKTRMVELEPYSFDLTVDRLRSSS